MKKYLIGLFCLIPLAGVSQPVMTFKTHGLQPGAPNTMQQVGYVAPGDGGANALWDFSKAPIAGNAEIQETILLADDNQRVTVTNAHGGKFSYTCDFSGNTFNGYEDAGQSIIYDQPIKKVSYPFSYGDALAGNFSARTTYPNSTMEHYMAGSYSSEGDGYGTLVLPNGRVLKNVLRLRTVEKYVEERCQSAEVEMVKYLWYIEEYRYPVFVTWNVKHVYADGREVNSQASFCENSQVSFYATATLPQVEDKPVYGQDEDESGNALAAQSIQHSVYPNPYSDYMHITYTLDKPAPVNIALYSLSGNLVSEIVSGQVQDGVQHVTYTPRSSAEISGTYYLRLQFGDKVYVRALLKN